MLITWPKPPKQYATVHRKIDPHLGFVPDFGFNKTWEKRLIIVLEYNKYSMGKTLNSYPKDASKIKCLNEAYTYIIPTSWLRIVENIDEYRNSY